MNNEILNKDFNYLQYCEIINSKFKKIQILFLNNEKKQQLISNLKINNKIIFKDLNLIFNINDYQIQKTLDENNFIVIWEGENI